MKKGELIILTGQYSQKYYLGDKAGENLTETVKSLKNKIPPDFLQLVLGAAFNF
jgi:uracil-DNA glycosylase